MSMRNIFAKHPAHIAFRARKTGTVFFALFAIAFISLFSACKKVKNLANINFDVPYNQQITVPSSGYPYGTPLPAGGITLPFPAIPVPTNAQQYVAQYGTSTDKILMVNLKSMTLDIVSPAGQNFDFLDKVDIYVSAKSQPEVLVASQSNVPKGQTSLHFDASTSVNLKSYFLADTIYFRMNAHINAVPPVGEELKLSTVFHVLANPLQ